jgi:hypothetical protein
LTRSLILIVLESMPSTQLIPAIRSPGVGGSLMTDLFRFNGQR